MPDALPFYVKTTSSTSGTGAIVLDISARTTAHRTTAQAVADGDLVDGDTVGYVIKDSTVTGDANFEAGIAVFNDDSSSPTLTRSAANVISGHNGPGVLWSLPVSGQRDVLIMSPHVLGIWGLQDGRIQVVTEGSRTALWIFGNAKWVESSSEFQRVDTSEEAFGVQLVVDGDIPGESESGVVLWKCDPGSNPIAGPVETHYGSGGWEVVTCWDYSGKVGIGTTDPTANGVARLGVYGPDSSISGPHLQAVTDADDYPLFQLLNYTHGNIQVMLDCYFNGTIVASSSLSSNYRIRLAGGALTIESNYGIAPGVDCGSGFSPRITIDSTGVGIRTSSPAATLHVYHPTSVETRVENGASADAKLTLKNAAPSQWDVRVTSGDEFQIVDGGTVAVVRILGGSNQNSILINSTKVAINDSGSGLSFVVEGDNDANLIATDPANDRVGIGTATPQAKLDIASGDLYVRNNVGIGTATPQSELDIDGDLYVRNNIGVGTASPGEKLHISDTGNAVAKVESTAGSSTFRATGQLSGGLTMEDSNAASGKKIIQLFNSSGDLYLRRTNDAETAVNHTILHYAGSTNNLGVGTTGPGEALEVNGKVKLTGGPTWHGNLASAPENPSKGDFYFDTTTNKHTGYDGTSWNEW